MRERAPRLLLLTGTAPRPDGVGGIILHDLIAALPAGQCTVAVTAENAAELCAGEADWHPVAVDHRRLAASRWGRVGRLARWPLLRMAHRRAVSTAVVRCADIARAEGVDEIWAVLDSPATIELAVPVAKSLGKPLRVTVWDDVEHNIGYFGIDSWTGSRLRSCFAEACRTAVSMAVIGETMQAEYLQRYGKRGFVVRHGADAAPSPTVRPNESSELRIGFAGSVSARSAFDCLLKALDQVDWSIQGRPVTLVLMGGRFDIWSRTPRRIEVLGWRSVEETVRILSGCTISYLPQAFEASWRSFSEWSFPSKLTTYLAAGAPILLHAPEYASLPGYLKQRQFAAVCHRLDVEELVLALTELATDQKKQDMVQSEAREALRQDFSKRRFLESFFEFLEVDPACLEMASPSRAA